MSHFFFCFLRLLCSSFDVLPEQAGVGADGTSALTPLELLKQKVEEQKKAAGETIEETNTSKETTASAPAPAPAPAVGIALSGSSRRDSPKKGKMGAAPASIAKGIGPPSGSRTDSTFRNPPFHSSSSFWSCSVSLSWPLSFVCWFVSFTLSMSCLSLSAMVRNLSCHGRGDDEGRERERERGVIRSHCFWRRELCFWRNGKEKSGVQTDVQQCGRSKRGDYF
jgi:hypothetical protein